MQEKELIPVFIRVRDGKTTCVCHAKHKRCRCGECIRDKVTRDKFEGWRDTMYRDRYGKGRD